MYNTYILLSEILFEVTSKYIKIIFSQMLKLFEIKSVDTYKLIISYIVYILYK